VGLFVLVSFGGEMCTLISLMMCYGGGERQRESSQLSDYSKKPRCIVREPRFELAFQVLNKGGDRVPEQQAPQQIIEQACKRRRIYVAFRASAEISLQTHNQQQPNNTTAQKQTYPPNEHTAPNKPQPTKRL
jgi:hypothetical protein